MTTDVWQKEVRPTMCLDCGDKAAEILWERDAEITRLRCILRRKTGSINLPAILNEYANWVISDWDASHSTDGLAYSWLVTKGYLSDELEMVDFPRRVCGMPA